MWQEVFTGSLWVLLYYAVAVLFAIAVRFTGKLPNEVFRKLLHWILIISLVVWTLVFASWQAEAVSVALFIAVVYPILWVLERWPQISRLATERKKGELRMSLVEAFGTFLVLICVCQGIFGDQWLTLASIAAWGPGDAAAALVGKRFGRRKIYRKKTVAGTVAMAVVSCLSVGLVLWLRGGLSLPRLALTASVTGVACAATELFTPGGWDTATCPLVGMGMLLLLIYG